MDELIDATSVISSRATVKPRVGVILGSGLGPVADWVEDPVVVPYGDIPGFPCTTVPGHQGQLVLGTMEGVPVAMMKGRPHIYEGYTPPQVGFPVRLLHALGVRVLVVTNAAGGLRPGLRVGTLMLLEDHINLPGLVGQNPLAGVLGDEERFVNMVGAYDPELRGVVREAAVAGDVRVASGVYVMVAGPTYETPAEARMLRQLGADAVGMSTVQEVVVARGLGMRVLGISCIANSVPEPSSQDGVDHHGVLAVAAAAAPDLAFLLRRLLAHLRSTGDG